MSSTYKITSFADDSAVVYIGSNWKDVNNKVKKISREKTFLVQGYLLYILQKLNIFLLIYIEFTF